MRDEAIFWDCPRCGRDWCKPLNDDDDVDEKVRKFSIYGTEWLYSDGNIPSTEFGFLSYAISTLKSRIGSCNACGHLFDPRPRARLMTFKQWKWYRRKKRLMFWRKR